MRVMCKRKEFGDCVRVVEGDLTRMKRESLKEREEEKVTNEMIWWLIIILIW